MTFFILWVGREERKRKGVAVAPLQRLFCFGGLGHSQHEDGRRKKKKLPQNYLHDTIIKRYIISNFYTEKRFQGVWEPIGVGLIDLYGLVSGDSCVILYFASVAYGQRLSGHTHMGILVLHLRGRCVFLRYPQKRRLGSAFPGFGRARLIAGRRSREGDSTTEAFVTHLGKKSSSERHDCWATSRRLDDGKRHAERRYDLYYYTMLCIYPRWQSTSFHGRQRRRRVTEKLTLATAL